MRFFKKILGRINHNNAKNLYGTVEDWEASSPSELKKYKENIAQAVEAKHITPGMLGRFLVVTGDAEEGERVLNNAVQDGVENAEKDYSETLSYYYVSKGKYNTALKHDKWFEKWIDASEKCVEQGQNLAETRLADIYSACYGINDPEFENKLGRIVELFEIAGAKHQSMAALNYGRFIENTLSSEEYKQKNGINYRPFDDAKSYFLQAIKDEKGTQFEASANEAIMWHYVECMKRILYSSLDVYFEKNDLTGMYSKINTYYQEAQKYLKNGGVMKESIEESLNDYRTYFELVLLADELRLIPSFSEITDNFVWQIIKKHYPDAPVTIPKEECLMRMATYFVEHKKELTRNRNYSQAFYDFIEKRLTKI
ncbi:hypothetical protein [Listeria booriae]|uniref:DUF4034 domain-containing protein n=1 Tax=Listeria booriae TaxID=1552123 RepID=A0A7X0TN73_9LIST|nr:hypothetical protein [Listeria booriae]MBC1233692.1 hypothetical protein [Listeria booriae]MBC1245941.1 hypothetical protein [Listeria booriae]MBC1307381.1 hypothetical protein [Listeria booriae]MBC1331912.1 hypothetical protein [Listeria booriae]MBC2387689.1 hypothetical protein [Listeria booriae]